MSGWGLKPPVSTLMGGSGKECDVITKRPRWRLAFGEGWVTVMLDTRGLCGCVCVRVCV